jgi:hypothetical protein
MFSYRSIFRKAFKITWNNKYLWFFGLFASVIGIGAEYQIFVNAMTPAQYAFWRQLSDTGIFNGFFHNLALIWAVNPWFFFNLLMVLIAGAVIIWAAIVSQAALVQASEKIIDKQEGSLKSTLVNGLKIGKKKFWPVFSLNLIIKVVVTMLVCLVSLPLLSAGESHNLDALYIILFLTLVPAALVFSLMMKYAIAFIVIKHQKIWTALQNAWQLLKDNWMVSLEMAFMLFLIDFLFAFVLLCVLVFLFIVITNIFSLALIFISAIALIIGIIIAGSALTTFQIAAWTDLFLKLRRGSASSKLQRLVTPAAPASKK